MKKYMKPSSEVINILTEGTLAASGLQIGNQSGDNGGLNQYSQGFSVNMDNDSDNYWE